jgi:hypothetical protein
MDRSSGNDGNTFFMEQEFEQIAYSIQMFWQLVYLNHVFIVLLYLRENQNIKLSLIEKVISIIW